MEGLYAVSESTSGVHGVNRLGGNSLAETVVCGKILDERLAEHLRDLPEVTIDPEAMTEHFRELETFASGEGEHDPEELIGELRD